MLALALLVTACGPSAPAGGPLDAHFRAIQRAEARLETAARALERITASISPDQDACVERCDPAQSAGNDARLAAGDVCAIAERLRDADANLRCERAQARSAAVSGAAQALSGRCGCDALDEASRTP